MKEKEMVQIARKAVRKDWSYDDLESSHEMQDLGLFVEDVMEYVIECEEVGTIAFEEKYKEYL